MQPMSEVETLPAKKGLFRRYLWVIVGLVLAGSAIIGLSIYASQPIKVEQIRKGTGTVVARHDVPASQRTHTECTGIKPMVCSDVTENIPESWSLSVSDGSGEIQNVPVTQGQFNAIRPGETFTRK